MKRIITIIICIAAGAVAKAGIFDVKSLTKTDDKPVTVRAVADSTWFIDFGKDTFAQLTLTLKGHQGDTATIHLGEQQVKGRVNRHPEGSQRYAMYRLPLKEGTHIYELQLRKDHRNTTPKQNESRVDPILMPDSIGEVYPFRYVEIEGVKKVKARNIVRHTVHYPFNWKASHFESSDTVLNAVWDLCKHTVYATSFAGIYVDGDRERIPYEADAIINQLSHYAADGDVAMARRSVRHLIYNPTWPTEWNLQTLIMVWNDYLYTGDTALMAETYDDLKAKTMVVLRDSCGLISTRTGKATKAFYESLHFRGPKMRDIVDWPQVGAAGIEKEADGEADGFVFTDYNAVVNAYHYNATVIMSNIAYTLGKDNDAERYAYEAAVTREAFNTLLRDSDGVYRDGITTTHRSLHTNMFALAFGLTDDDNRESVVAFIKSRGMACSVYGAQFLLDALYAAGEADYALSLLNSTALRSWYNMIRIGSTITTEAWDNVFKANQDWNHPWGAAAMNIIARKVMGIEPATPGFETVRIKPQTGSLSKAAIIVPTIRGAVKVAFENSSGTFSLKIDVPKGMKAEVWLPDSDKPIMTGDGKRTFTR